MFGKEEMEERRKQLLKQISADVLDWTDILKISAIIDSDILVQAKTEPIFSKYRIGMD